jgi:hypothetical protein
MTEREKSLFFFTAEIAENAEKEQNRVSTFFFQRSQR